MKTGLGADKFLGRFTNLPGKFAGGEQYQSRRAFRIEQMRQHRKSKSGGLACSGLRRTENIIPVERRRNSLLLNWGGISKIYFFQGV